MIVPTTESPAVIRLNVSSCGEALKVPVISIIALDDVIDMLEDSNEFAENLEPVMAYRKKFGVNL